MAGQFEVVQTPLGVLHGLETRPQFFSAALAPGFQEGGVGTGGGWVVEGSTNAQFQLVVDQQTAD